MVVLVVSLLAAVAVAQKVLPRHSFTSPLNYNGTLAEWHMTGVMIPTRKSVMLNPGIVDRAGIMWHKTPLLTEDWAVAFDFTAKGEANTVQEQGFGFWYGMHGPDVVGDSKTFQTAKSDVTKHLEANGATVFGMKSTFEGFGLVFSNVKTKSRTPFSVEHKPCAALVISDGKNAIDVWGDNVAGSKCVEIPFRNTNVPVKVEIRVERGNKLKATVNCGSSPVTIYDGAITAKKGGYMGFACATGKPLPDVKKADIVSLNSLTVSNMDTAATGEEAGAIPTGMPTGDGAADWLHEHSLHKDHRQESEAIKDLTHWIYKLVSETEPMRMQIFQAISTLNTKVEALEGSLSALKDEVKQRSGSNMDEEFNSMKKELNTLTKYASTEHAARQKKVDSLHKDIDAVKSTAGDQALETHLNALVDQNQLLHEAINQGSWRTFWISVVAIIFIVVAGFGLYNKFRCWEKKHIL